MCPVLGSRALLIATLLVPALASADKRQALGNGSELVFSEPSSHQRGTLEVRKDKLRVRLVEALRLTKIVVDAEHRKVDVDVEAYWCDSSKPEHRAWTFAQLEAKLENTAAFALHTKKEYKAAALGFARAAAADPTWRIPAYNLASAHTLLGNHDAAIQALSPWLTTEPVATFVQVTSDPELSPLLDRPELVAIRAAHPGAVKLGATGLEGEVAYAPALGLLAVTRKEQSWATCAYQTNLELHDVATGTLVATTPVVTWPETSSGCDQAAGGIEARARGTVVKRVEKLQTMLVELGFATANIERGSAIESVPAKGPYPKQKSFFKQRKIGLVAADGTARVLAGNTELATAKILDTMRAAVFVPETSTMIVWSLHPGAEACEGTDPTVVTILPIKSAPSP